MGRTQSEAPVPSFASRFWTLTWAEKGPGFGPPNIFSGRPLRLDLYHPVLAESIMPEATPLPVSWFLHQSAFDGSL